MKARITRAAGEMTEELDNAREANEARVVESAYVAATQRVAVRTGGELWDADARAAVAEARAAAAVARIKAAAVEADERAAALAAEAAEAQVAAAQRMEDAEEYVV